jgi:DNA-binding MarR family transcriptional regulator
MEKILIEFINTLDYSFKKLQAETIDTAEVSQLTISQFQYINAIYELEKPTITEVAQKLAIAKASVSTGISKLIKQGYVTKTQSAQDKRIFYLGLTQKSEQLINTKYQALQQYGDFISAALSQEEAAQFEAILTKLVQLFQTA